MQENPKTNPSTFTNFAKMIKNYILYIHTLMFLKFGFLEEHHKMRVLKLDVEQCQEIKQLI